LREFKTVDLFAGGGGLSLGFANAGFKLAAAFDSWEPAFNLYRANFTGHPIFQTDISNGKITDEVKRFAPEIIIGGPPCQDFSQAGKRGEELGRADLTVSFARIVGTIRPKYFVMENVPRTVASMAFAKAKKMFENSGYGLSIRTLDASLCGVPQRRKRLFVVGELGGIDGFLDTLLEAGQSRKRMTLRDYFGGKLGLQHYYRHPRSYGRRGIFGIDEPSPTVRGVNRPVPKGYPGHPSDASPLNANIRSLTTKERSMIQTFPASFKLVGPNTTVEQIIGNAVPVKLAEFVASALMKHIKNKNG